MAAQRSDSRRPTNISAYLVALGGNRPPNTRNAFPLAHIMATLTKMPPNLSVFRDLAMRPPKRKTSLLADKYLPDGQSGESAPKPASSHSSGSATMAQPDRPSPGSASIAPNQSMRQSQKSIASRTIGLHAATSANWLTAHPAIPGRSTGPSQPVPRTPEPVAGARVASFPGATVSRPYTFSATVLGQQSRSAIHAWSPLAPTPPKSAALPSTPGSVSVQSAAPRRMAEPGPRTSTSADNQAQSAPFELQPYPPQQDSYTGHVPDAGSNEATGSSASGDLYLDGALLGRWVTRHIERLLSRPPLGTTAVDGRAYASWPGSPTHV
jgi:hypothetical protein